MAGLTVAAVAVPQAMAYAQIAGLPPQYGLYTAIVMTARGGTLRFVEAADQWADQRHFHRRVERRSSAFPTRIGCNLAIVLAFLVGAVQWADHAAAAGRPEPLHLARGDRRLHARGRHSDRARPGQEPVRAAVRPAPARNTFSSVSGSPSRTSPRPTGRRFWSAWARSSLRWRCGYFNRRLRYPRCPDLLLAVMCMAAVVWALELDEQGVQSSARSRPSCPPSNCPSSIGPACGRLAGSSLAIALLGLLEAIAMAKAIAAQTGQKLDINQQCLSEGAGQPGRQLLSMLSRLRFADPLDDQPAGRRPDAVVGRDLGRGRGAHRAVVRPALPITFRRRPGRHPHAGGLAARRSASSSSITCERRAPMPGSWA